MVAVRRFDVVLVRLDPTEGAEMRKTRPSVVISPDEMNQSLRTVLVAPMTTGGQAYPWRVDVAFARKSGRIALDQLRSIDGTRILRRLGTLDTPTSRKALDTLAEMFAP